MAKGRYGNDSVQAGFQKRDTSYYDRRKPFIPKWTSPTLRWRMKSTPYILPQSEQDIENLYMELSEVRIYRTGHASRSILWYLQQREIQATDRMDKESTATGVSALHGIQHIQQTEPMDKGRMLFPHQRQNPPQGLLCIGLQPDQA